MEKKDTSRRDFLLIGSIGGASVLAACTGRSANIPVANTQNASTPGAQKFPDPKEVTAVEDLMREHGILRRALLVYDAAALRLRKNAGEVSPEALKKTANLFRTFGEDYHEKKLEEAFIFPRLKDKASGTDAVGYVDVLIQQHVRGREITDYILSVANAPKIGAEGARFADVLEGFVRMYQHHAAREDTIIFPVWKDVVTSAEYDELNDKFEDIEHEQFGADGFEDAVKQIGEIEASLGLSDIGQFTPPSPH